MANSRTVLSLLPPLLALLAVGQGQASDAPLPSPESTVKVYGPYQVIRLPVAKGVKILNPIKISLGPDGRLFAANQTGEVYVLRDSDGDGLEDETVLYCNVSQAGLNSPGGFTSRGDTVFIGTRQEIRAYRDTDGDGRADTSWTFFKDIPHGAHPYEWTSGLCFGPDGWLYCALATDSWNAGASPDPKGYRGSLLRISPDGKTAERVATGLRSVYGMAFNRHGDLFFTDNEGGGNPKEELNRLVRGRFYGHNHKKFPERDATQPAEPPDLILENEVAPAGMAFNATSNDFGGTAGDLFVAYYGPGERWSRGGVGRVRITRQSDGTYRYAEFPVVDLPKLRPSGQGQSADCNVGRVVSDEKSPSPRGCKLGWLRPILGLGEPHCDRAPQPREPPGQLTADSTDSRKNFGLYPRYQRYSRSTTRRFSDRREQARFGGIGRMRDHPAALRGDYPQPTLQSAD